MRVILFITVLFYCVTQGCAQAPEHKKDTFICNYVGSCREDTVNHRLVWQPLKPHTEKNGPVVFKWQPDSTVWVCYDSKRDPKPLKYTPARFTRAEMADIPATLLNNTFKLRGVYEHPEYPGSGIFFRFYENGDDVLAQIYLWPNMLMNVFYYSPDSVNNFEQAGIMFPFHKRMEL